MSIYMHYCLIIVTYLVKTTLSDVTDFKSISAENIRWGKTYDGMTLASFTNVSFANCTKICRNTEGCKSINYEIRFRLCRLFETAESEISDSTQGNSTYQILSTLYVDEQHMVLFPICDSLTSIQITGCTNEPKIKITDCGQPPPSSDMSITKVEGTTLNSKITFQCNSGDRYGRGYIECQDDGQWSSFCCPENVALNETALANSTTSLLLNAPVPATVDGHRSTCALLGYYPYLKINLVEEYSISSVVVTGRNMRGIWVYEFGTHCGWRKYKTTETLTLKCTHIGMPVISDSITLYIYSNIYADNTYICEVEVYESQCMR